MRLWEGDDPGWDGWMASLTQWTWVWVNSNQTPGVGDGQGGLACCDSWGRKESDRTERLNWTDTWESYVRENCLIRFCSIFEVSCLDFHVGLIFMWRRDYVVNCVDVTNIPEISVLTLWKSTIQSHQSPPPLCQPSSMHVWFGTCDIQDFYRIGN